MYCSGYSTNGQYDKTLDFCKRIPTPWSEVQYIIVYKACASLCDETAKTLGKKVLKEMPKSFLDNVVVTTAIIHMLMRFSEVETAERFITRIKRPDRHLYGTLINGYRINEEPHKCLSLFDEMKRKGMTVNEPIALSLVGACAQIGMRSVSEEIGATDRSRQGRSAVAKLAHRYVGTCALRSAEFKTVSLMSL